MLTFLLLLLVLLFTCLFIRDLLIRQIETLIVVNLLEFELSFEAELELLLKFIDHESARSCHVAELLLEEVEVNESVVRVVDFLFLRIFEFHLTYVFLQVLLQQLCFRLYSISESFKLRNQLIKFTCLRILSDQLLLLFVISF